MHNDTRIQEIAFRLARAIEHYRTYCTEGTHTSLVKIGLAIGEAKAETEWLDESITYGNAHRLIRNLEWAISDLLSNKGITND